MEHFSAAEVAHGLSSGRPKQTDGVYPGRPGGVRGSIRTYMGARVFVASLTPIVRHRFIPSFSHTTCTTVFWK